MALQLLTGNADPVSSDELVERMRLDDADVQSDFLALCIAAASENFQEFTRQQLTNATFRMRLDCFPRCAEIIIPRPPLASVSAVKYLDIAGTEHTLDSSLYTVDTDSKPGRVVLNDWTTWPVTAHRANAVAIEFAAGYGDASAVPKLMIAAIGMMAGYWYESRDIVTYTTLAEMPLALRSIIDANTFYAAASE